MRSSLLAAVVLILIPSAAGALCRDRQWCLCSSPDGIAEATSESTSTGIGARVTALHWSERAGDAGSPLSGDVLELGPDAPYQPGDRALIFLEQGTAGIERIFELNERGAVVCQANATVEIPADEAISIALANETECIRGMRQHGYEEQGCNDTGCTAGGVAHPAIVVGLLLAAAMCRKRFSAST